MSQSPVLESDLDAAFGALSDPTRRAILSRLARGDAAVSELAEPFDLTQQAVSRHVGVLKRSGLIEQRTAGRRRPCRLNVEHLDHVAGWIAEQRREWASRLDHLETHLASVQKGAR